MIIRSLHTRMQYKDNPVLILLGLIVFLVILCIAMGLDKTKDIFINLWGRLWLNG